MALGSLTPCLSLDTGGNYVAVVFSVEQAESVLSEHSAIQALLCVDVPRSAICTSLVAATMFFRSDPEQKEGR
jgi:hypothetical protein